MAARAAEYLLSLATEFTIIVVPEGHRLRKQFVDMGHYRIQVAYRDTDRWAVVEGGMILRRGGAWTYEPSPSNRTDAFKRSTWFPLEEAIERAEKATRKMLSDLEKRYPEENPNSDAGGGA